jgi:ketosteroid isomerase-like protein
VFTLRDGKILRFHEHSSKARAPEAVGRSAQGRDLGPTRDTSRVGKESIDSNRQVVLRLIDAVNRGDVGAIKAETAADFELHPLVSVWQRDYRGHAGISDWQRDLAEIWDEFTIQVDEVEEAAGAALIVVGRWRGKPKNAPAALEGPIAATVLVVGGKATKADVYLDRTEAMGAP